MSEFQEAVGRFVTLLLSEPKGQIVACNLVHCDDAKVVEPTEIRAILQLALRQFAMDAPTTCTELLGLLEIEWQDFRFHGPETPAADPTHGVGLHHVIKYEYFFASLTPALRISEGVVSRNPFAIVGGMEQVRKLDALSSKAKFMFPDGAKLGYGALWLTPADLRPLNADRARDLLGLVHHGAGVPLMRVSLTPASVQRFRTHRPTFASAGTHRRFRQRPGIDTPQGFGRAVDLEKHRTAAVGEVVDGAMEIVAEPQDIYGLDISWSCLGCTQVHGEPEVGPPAPTPNYDEIFVNRLLGDRTLDELRRDIEILCGNT